MAWVLEKDHARKWLFVQGYPAEPLDYSNIPLIVVTLWFAAHILGISKGTLLKIRKVCGEVCVY